MSTQELGALGVANLQVCDKEWEEKYRESQERQVRRTLDIFFRYVIRKMTYELIKSHELKPLKMRRDFTDDIINTLLREHLQLI